MEREGKLGVTTRHVSLREWADFKGHETREEKSDRQFRERTEDGLVASADAANDGWWPDFAQDRREREGVAA